MQRILDATRRSLARSAIHPYCCFAIDESGYPVRDIDLRSTYPYFCITVSYAELRLLKAAHEERAKVIMSNGEIQRAAVPIRVTRQGVVSLKFIEGPEFK